MIVFNDDRYKRTLAEMRTKGEEHVARFLAGQHKLPYIDLLLIPIETDALRLIPEDTARAAKVAPFRMSGKTLDIAVFSPDDAATKAALERVRHAGYAPNVHLATTKSLEKAWRAYQELSRATETRAGAIEIADEKIVAAAERIHSIPEAVPLIEESLASREGDRISRLAEMLLATALATDASDIHIEPEEMRVRLRFRLDGILQDTLAFERNTYTLLLSRLKLLSGLKLNVKNEAQDGRFSVTAKDAEVEIRASVLPGAYGESVVLRVLNPKSIAVPLEALGMHETLQAVIEREIKRPNGMILTTGPTGSGKTTTLYAFLRKIHSPGVKIITIEEPIEYHLAGIVQTQVNPKEHYTFASGLRSALRQDPDVMMVGEIRDAETAEIAVNSALTGHLVFSTLHTNNAAGTFPRLIDLGVNPKVITSALNIALAQRLVRKLCERCKAEAPLSDDARKRINEVLRSMNNGALVPQTEKMWLPKTCARCNNTGYQGRTGVYEAILADESMEQVVRSNPSEREVQKAAAAQGMLTMAQDGVLKVLGGITSLEEVERVVELPK